MRARMLLAWCLAVFFAAPAAHAVAITVTSNADAGAGTLRAAITAANASAGADEIDFSGPMAITVASALPAITGPVTINGMTGAGCTGIPELIALDGNDLSITGLELAAGSDGSRICALNVRDFDYGVVIDSDDGTVQGCRIGTTADGETAEGNDISGVVVRGDDATVTGNLLSGNDAGVEVVVPINQSVDGTTITGNLVGVDKDGATAIGNVVGIFVPATTTNTVIDGNLVSGNPGNGIMSGSGTVTGNTVGLNAAGDAAVPNSVGILANGPLTIGGTTTAERNVISGNDTGIEVAAPSPAIRGNWIGPLEDGSGSDAQHTGVEVSNDDAVIAGNVILADSVGVGVMNADDTVIQGNVIGLLPDGLTDMPASGAFGIDVATAAVGTQIGGTAAGDGNTIAGNNVAGIETTGSATVVEGNVIGLDENGGARPNSDGIDVGPGADTTRIGGTAAGAGNVISGNDGPGLRLDGADGITIQGNRIGVGADGTTARGNGNAGVEVAQSSQVTIGGNVIARNDGDGVDFFSLTTSLDAVVEGNEIEDNEGEGVHLQAVTGGRVGGTGAGAGNRIAGNGDDGVGLGSASSGVAVLGNSIDANGPTNSPNYLGIDLDNDGVTANDAGDGDTGANRGQNFPVLTSAETDGSSMQVAGTIDTTPGAQIRVEVFSSAACDDQGHGQGDVFLGATDVVAGTGPTAFSATVAATPGGRQITATATVTDGSIQETSEFSACFGATQEPVVDTGTGGGTSTSTTTAATPPPPPPPPPAPLVTPPPAPKFPAKIRVLRNGVDDGVLDMLIEVTSRAVTPGAVFSIDYESSGRHTKFTVPITGTQVKVRKRLPSSQPKDTGITTVTYAGNSLVGPDDVRLRAADGKSLLTRGTTTLSGGRLVVDGTVTSSARGVVRIRLGYNRPDGSTGFASWNAPIDDGRWKISQALTGDAARGGQLSIQFTGYEERNLRGEQTSKEVLQTARR